MTEIAGGRVVEWNVSTHDIYQVKFGGSDGMVGGGGAEHAVMLPLCLLYRQEIRYIFSVVKLTTLLLENVKLGKLVNLLVVWVSVNCSTKTTESV